MLTIFGVVSVLLLLAVHEWLVARRRAGPTASSMVRPLALAGALALSVLLGARTQGLPTVETVIASWFAEPRAFEPGANVFLFRTLRTQRPERRFPVDGGTDAVNAWREEVVDTLKDRTDFMTGSPPHDLSVQVLETEDVGEVRRTLVQFTSWDGTPIPAYVHEPLGATRLGAVLVIAGHGRGIRATAGIGRGDYQHAVALELARRGYITLAAELRGFGLQSPNGISVHTTVAQAALAAGTFYKAVVVRDLGLALTVLERWPGVDASRLGVVGTSLGGELAVLLGVLDPRPRVIISHSYGGATGPEPIGPMRDDTQETPHGCHTFPGINRIVHREDWFRLLAPRALQVARGDADLGRRADATDFEMAVARPYEQLGVRERFEFSVHAGRHELFLEPAVRFLAKWL